CRALCRAGRSRHVPATRSPQCSQRLAVQIRSLPAGGINGTRFTRSHGPEECRRPRLSAPHLGYVTREALIAFYADTLEAVLAFANGAPIRVAKPDALAHRKKS